MKSLCGLYQLSQLIKEPTRITETSSLLDILITNEPDKIVASGAQHLGITDHSLVYGIHKINGINRKTVKIIQTRSMRSFNIVEFHRDLEHQSWSELKTTKDTNEMWLAWKNMFLSVVDKHAPMKSKRIRSNNVPWVTNEIKDIIHERDKMKRKFIDTKNKDFWYAYKTLRNKVTIELLNTKRAYYNNEIEKQKGDPKRTWKKINQFIDKQTRLALASVLGPFGTFAEIQRW